MQQYIDDMPDWLRILLPKVIGYLVSMLVTWLGSKNITITKENEALMITGGIAVAGLVYGVVKTWLAAHLNPAGVNSPKLAGQVHADMKAEKSNGSD